MPEHDQTERNRTVIQRLYAAATAGDSAAIESLIDDSCVLTQSPGHPVPGTWTGREAMLQGMAQVFGVLRNTGITVHEIVADGPTRVIGLVDAHGTDTSGDAYEMPVAEIFEVADGKVTEIRPFYWDQIRLREITASN